MTVFFDIAVSFLIAGLAGMGVGTGGLLVVYLTLGERMSQLTAQGVNLLFYLAASIPSVLMNVKSKKLPLKEILTAAFFGLTGCFLGFWLSNSLTPILIRKIFGTILLLSGIITAIGTLKNK